MSHRNVTFMYKNRWYKVLNKHITHEQAVKLGIPHNHLLDVKDTITGLVEVAMIFVRDADTTYREITDEIDESVSSILTTRYNIHLLKKSNRYEAIGCVYNKKDAKEYIKYFHDEFHPNCYIISDKCMYIHKYEFVGIPPYSSFYDIALTPHELTAENCKSVFTCIILKLWSDVIFDLGHKIMFCKYCGHNISAFHPMWFIMECPSCSFIVTNKNNGFNIKYIDLLIDILDVRVDYEYGRRRIKGTSPRVPKWKPLKYIDMTGRQFDNTDSPIDNSKQGGSNHDGNPNGNKYIHMERPAVYVKFDTAKYKVLSAIYEKRGPEFLEKIEILDSAKTAKEFLKKVETAGMSNEIKVMNKIHERFTDKYLQFALIRDHSNMTKIYKELCRSFVFINRLYMYLNSIFKGYAFKLIEEFQNKLLDIYNDKNTHNDKDTHDDNINEKIQELKEELLTKVRARNVTSEECTIVKKLCFHYMKHSSKDIKNETLKAVIYTMQYCNWTETVSWEELGI